MARQTISGRFAALPIATKTMVLTAASTVIALVVLSVATVATSYEMAQRNLARDLDAQSTVLAESVGAAVVFGDQPLADQIARAVNNHWRVDAACIYDEAGRLFASSVEAGKQCSPSAPTAAKMPAVQRPIVVGGHRRGSVVITGNFDNLYAFTAIQSAVTGAVLLIGLTVALLMTHRLRSSIVTPIGELAQVADRIATSGDYSLRTTSATLDEVGEMSRAFNTMLDAIQGGAQALERAGHDLRASEARWRAIVECATDAIVVIDANGGVEAFNPAAEALFGYEESEILGGDVTLLLPDARPAHWSSPGQRGVVGMGQQVAGRHRDGRTLPLRLAAGAMTVDNEVKLVGILHDLTGRLDLEKRLRDQEALTKLGEMAAVLAHEVKNPIAGIRGAIQIIGSRLPTASKDASIVTEIVKRLDALDDLMKDLLTFARPREPRLEPIELAPLLREVADLVRHDPLHERLEIEITGSAPTLHADKDLLKIAVQNLVINSAHALNGQGRIGIMLTSDGSANRIVIADNGPGIPIDVRTKLFTPFFTTKARGTGLGLATAKRFVEAHRGTLTVDCPATGGTTMTIHLPGSAS